MSGRYPTEQLAWEHRNGIEAPKTAISASYPILLEMVRKDDPEMEGWKATEVVRRMLSRPGIQSCCIHQMPQGSSAFRDGVCVRCGLSA